MCCLCPLKELKGHICHALKKRETKKESMQAPHTVVNEVIPKKSTVSDSQKFTFGQPYSLRRYDPLDRRDWWPTHASRWNGKTRNNRALGSSTAWSRFTTRLRASLRLPSRFFALCSYSKLTSALTVQTGLHPQGCHGEPGNRSR